MNRTSLMLRDAAYIASIINRIPSITSEEGRQRGERIILRLLHRNKLSFIEVAVILFSELEQAGITLNDKRAVDLMQARLYRASLTESKLAAQSLWKLVSVTP